MATESVSIAQPIEVKSDSKSRVAFDLMEHIGRRDNIPDEQKKSRSYWLTLYVQCLKATSGEALQYVLEPK